MRPVLEAHAGGRPLRASDVRDRVAVAVGVPDPDRKIMLPSGRAARYDNRVAWAVTHLAQAGLLERSSRGVTELTERGRIALHDCPDRVDMAVLMGFPEYVEFRSRTRSPQDDFAGTTNQQIPPGVLNEPGTAIEEVIHTAHSAVAADLLSRIVKQPPEFLERLVLELLVSMGYGGLERSTEHLGGSGDAGLDGLIRLDVLGLDIVYLQAKRYADRHVGRPEIQAFVGALHGAQASRGIFITTSRFSAEARDYAERVNARVILIDGPELARLMIEHGCGVVTEATYTLKQVDENFFPEP
ncbi:restriction endonuclease [Actinoplanes sp. NPDC051411]|uniref:restriction endonuclease n=1 Tax=Actinoplanes sp. NPDC051411 TaxID=3155522 RepID=UPI00342B19DA